MTPDCGKEVWEWTEGRVTWLLSSPSGALRERLLPRGQGKVAPGTGTSSNREICKFIATFVFGVKPSGPVGPALGLRHLRLTFPTEKAFYLLPYCRAPVFGLCISLARRQELRSSLSNFHHLDLRVQDNVNKEEQRERDRAFGRATGAVLVLGTPRSRSGALVGGRVRTAPSVSPAPGGPRQCFSLSLPGAGLEGRWSRAKALARNQNSASKCTGGGERALSSEQRGCRAGDSRPVLWFCRELRAMERDRGIRAFRFSHAK